MLFILGLIIPAALAAELLARSRDHAWHSQRIAAYRHPAELAEMEAAPHTDEYDDAFDFYYDLSDAELAQLYASRAN